MNPEDTEYTDKPTCPYCGYVVECLIDYDGGFYSEELFEYDCPECNKPIRSQAHISFSYTTTPIDREEEARQKAMDDAKKAERIAQRLAECQKWLPGTKVRIKDKSPMTHYRERTGVVANREITKYNPFVEVDLDLLVDGKPYETFFHPEDLEELK